MQSVYVGGVDNQVADYKKVIEVYHNAGFTGIDNQVEYVKDVQAKREAQQQAEKTADQARIQETNRIGATMGIDATLHIEGQANISKAWELDPNFAQKAFNTDRIARDSLELNFQQNLSGGGGGRTLGR